MEQYQAYIKRTYGDEILRYIFVSALAPEAIENGTINLDKLKQVTLKSLQTYKPNSVQEERKQVVSKIQKGLDSINLEKLTSKILNEISLVSLEDFKMAEAVVLQGKGGLNWGFDAAKAPSTTFTIGIDTPDVVRAKTKECAEKFNILKVKLGRDNDKEMIETIRSVTNLPIAIDANQGWKDKKYALDMIHWLNERGIVMIEQPMPKSQIDDIAWVTEHSPLPVFADESIQRLSDVAAQKGVFSGINIKLMKCTGMREAWKMLNLARALDMKVMIGCMTETSCACSAAAQLSPAVDFADLDGNLLIANDRFKGMEVVGGKITIPNLPGIGVVKL